MYELRGLVQREVEKLKKKIKLYQDKLSKIQDKCLHENHVVLRVDNDDNGWDKNVWVNWSETRHCKDCDKRYSVDTGKTWSY